MEQEDGIPKKNYFIAIVLAVAVYGVWYYFLPKPQRAPQSQESSAVSQKPESQAPDSTVPVPELSVAPVQAGEQEFVLDGFSGKVRLDGAGFTGLDSHQVKGDIGQNILSSGSDFLATRVLSAPQAVWKLAGEKENRARFELPLAGGVLEKEIAFQPDGFGTLKLSLSKSASAAQQVQIHLSQVFPYSDESNTQSFMGYEGKKGLIVQHPKKKEEKPARELAPGKPLTALGTASRYHMTVLYGLNPSLQASRPPKSSQWNVYASLAPGQSLELPFYAGLKREAVMEKLSLENLMYGGMLGPLKKLIQSSLTKLYQLTGNYGVAIILLTLSFQIILLPLTWKNVKLSQKMKEIMPKVKVIQEKYKQDPTKMNQELMTLYRTQGANPLGGCLLLLPQMPIFFALYSSLSENYALFGAPFVLWIQNLAAHDPTYILPLVMGGAMFLQTKLSAASTPSDPSQKMLSYMMPIMFTVMFLKFPSGLVLYWLTSNVLSIGISQILPKFMERA